MALILILLFIVLPIAELYVIIQVGGAIGVLPTLGLLILDSILGAWLWRSQGTKAWARFNQALAEGRVPAREVFDGAMVILGGALLVTPGFITDIFGLILLIPPTRALVRGTMSGFAKRRVAFGWRVASPPPRPGSGTPPPGTRGYDYEGTAREVNETELPPGSGNAA
jgi:UPF0716 protein FxsA